jgi:hypothetical protein
MATTTAASKSALDAREKELTVREISRNIKETADTTRAVGKEKELADARLTLTKEREAATRKLAAKQRELAAPTERLGMQEASKARSTLELEAVSAKLALLQSKRSEEVKNFQTEIT